MHTFLCANLLRAVFCKLSNACHIFWKPCPSTSILEAPWVGLRRVGVGVGVGGHSDQWWNRPLVLDLTELSGSSRQWSKCRRFPELLPGARLWSHARARCRTSRSPTSPRFGQTCRNKFQLLGKVYMEFATRKIHMIWQVNATVYSCRP
jgi:hypothetical protein